MDRRLARGTASNTRSTRAGLPLDYDRALNQALEEARRRRMEAAEFFGSERIGKIPLADTIRALRGPKYKSALPRSLSAGSFNRSIRSPKTDRDWIRRDGKTSRQARQQIRRQGFS